jgi:hypothetical protein
MNNTILHEETIEIINIFLQSLLKNIILIVPWISFVLTIIVVFSICLCGESLIFVTFFMLGVFKPRKRRIKKK